MKKQTWHNVLVYRSGRRSQNTIRKYYIEWRNAQTPALQPFCNIQECYFHTKPLVWNNKELRLILDHVNGVSGDNRPKNLRLLCPNCNSQQLTQGGGNKGKTEQHDGGFVLISSEKKKNYVLPVETGKFIVNFPDVKLTGDKE